ncbi:MAG: LrgB family protein [Bacteroidales bacterium]|nr:LrgB family protein [Bacteroidales bacterium]
MKDIIFSSEPFMLMLVCGSFLLGTYIYKKTKFALFHPCIIAMAVIISFLLVFDISYETFSKGSRIIHFLLGPAVVALGVVLYEQTEYLKQNIVSMFTAITIGSFIGVGSVIAIGKIMGVDAQLIFSLEPKSVTTPIAISLSNANGGLPAVTAVTVVVCGIIGAVFGPKLLELIGIDSSVAKGLSLGAASHGLGTARAMEIGAVEGAISGLSIGLMGAMTSFAIPVIHYIIN